MFMVFIKSITNLPQDWPSKILQGCGRSLVPECRQVFHSCERCLPFESGRLCSGVLDRVDLQADS